MANKSYEKLCETLGIEEITDNLKGITDAQLAERIASCDEWIPELLEELCYRADMSEEWSAADGDSFESVAFAAADKLGVEIVDN